MTTPFLQARACVLSRPRTCPRAPEPRGRAGRFDIHGSIRRCYNAHEGRRAMPTNNLEERLAAVEKELDSLRAMIAGINKPWWEEIVGTFANDPTYDEAMRLGRKW